MTFDKEGRAPPCGSREVTGLQRTFSQKHFSIMQELMTLVQNYQSLSLLHFVLRGTPLRTALTPLPFCRTCPPSSSNAPLATVTDRYRAVTNRWGRTPPHKPSTNLPRSHSRRPFNETGSGETRVQENRPSGEGRPAREEEWGRLERGGGYFDVRGRGGGGDDGG